MALSVERLDGGVALVTLTAESAQNAFSIEAMTTISQTINSLIEEVDKCLKI